MPGSPTEITSSAHLTTLLSTHTLLIADFHASWCGPCHAIAPLFASLAATHTVPQRLGFVKIDVDAHPDLARQFGVSAMPTFLTVRRGGRVGDTVRGANTGALRSMVEKAAREAKKDGGAGAVGGGGAAFGGAGRTLGAEGRPSRRVGGSAVDGWESWVRRVRVGAGGGGWAEGLVRFVALYLTSLLSLDAAAAAEASPFSVKNRGR